MEKQLLHDEMRRAEQRGDALGRQIEDLREQMSAQAAQAESELVASQLERRGRQEVAQRSSQLEEVRAECDRLRPFCDSSLARLCLDACSPHDWLRPLCDRLPPSAGGLLAPRLLGSEWWAGAEARGRDLQGAVHAAREPVRRRARHYPHAAGTPLMSVDER